MGWVYGALAVVSLAVGLFHLARLAVRRRDADSELAHAVMGLGMAAMFSPLGNPVPAPVWTTVFLLCGAWFGAALLRTRALGGDATHHVVGSAAMLFMLVAGHAGHAAGDGAHAGHATADTLGFGSVVALVLTAYFAWHALRCADRCRSPTEAAGPTGAGTGTAAPRLRVAGPEAAVASLSAPRGAAVAHLVMAGSMAVMLFGMV